jgi:hypothetical protein
MYAGGDARLTIKSDGKIGIGNIASPVNNVEIRTDAHGEGITIKSTGNTSNALTFDANRGTQGVIGVVYGRWNGTTVAQMNFVSGDDGTDKNDGYITFGTESAASNGNVNATERLRIDSDGDLIHTSNDKTLSLVATQNQVNAGTKIAFFGANRYDTDEEFASIKGLLKNNSGGTSKQKGHLLFTVGSNSHQHIMNDDGHLGINTDFTGSQTWRSGQRLEIFGGGGNVTGELHLGANRGDGVQAVGSINFFDNTQDSNHKHVAIIEVDKAGSTANKRGGDLNFYTKNDNVAAPTQKVRITTKGTTVSGGTIPSDAVTYSSSFRGREGVIGPIYYWPRVYGVHDKGGGYTDVSEGNRLTLRMYGSLGGTASMFQNGFSANAYGAGGEALAYNRVRVLFRVSRANTTDGYNANQIQFKMQSYYYSGGWTDITNSAWNFSGTDGERGYRWTASNWISLSDFAGGADVPSIAIKYESDLGNMGNDNIRIAAVYLQYAYFN